MAESNTQLHQHGENVAKALSAVGHEDIGKKMIQANAMGIDWITLIQNLVTMALPVFLAWLNSILNPPQPTPPPAP